MRFNSYLTEATLTEKSLNKLLPDYSEILDIYKKSISNYLYRGTKHKFTFASKVPRKRRRPMDMPLLFHEYLDEMFQKHFGWNARSNGLFTSISLNGLSYYGSNTYIIFPKNGFNYVYNQNIPDLYRYIDKFFKINLLNNDDDAYMDFEKDTLTSDTKKEVEKIVKEYTDKGLDKLLKSPYDDIEVAIRCDKYYLLHKDYDHILESFLRTIL